MPSLQQVMGSGFTSALIAPERIADMAPLRQTNSARVFTVADSLGASGVRRYAVDPVVARRVWMLSEKLTDLRRGNE